MSEVATSDLLAFIRIYPVVLFQSVIEHFVRLELDGPWVSHTIDKQPAITILPFPGHKHWQQYLVYGETESLLAPVPTKSETFILTALPEARTQFEYTTADLLFEVNSSSEATCAANKLTNVENKLNQMTLYSSQTMLSLPEHKVPTLSTMAVIEEVEDDNITISSSTTEEGEVCDSDFIDDTNDPDWEPSSDDEEEEERKAILVDIRELLNLDLTLQ